MNKLIVNTLLFLGLNKAALKISLVISGVSVWLTNLLDFSQPKEILGTTLFLWLAYVMTIMLDWRSGLRASKFEARKAKIPFVYDKDKENVNWYKHALFIIIIATIYHFRLESESKNMSNILTNSLVGIKYGYFAYSMITEWKSIEDNRFRITNKKSRLSKLIDMVLDTVDRGAKKKIEDLTNTKE